MTEPPPNRVQQKNPFESPATEPEEVERTPFVGNRVTTLVAFGFLLIGTLFATLATFVAASFFIAPFVSPEESINSFFDLVLIGLVGLASVGVGVASWRLIWTSLIAPLRRLETDADHTAT